MASITFGCDEKGEHQICDRKEILHEVGVFLSKMWNDCSTKIILLLSKSWKGLVSEKRMKDVFGVFIKTQTNMISK